MDGRAGIPETGSEFSEHPVYGERANVYHKFPCSLMSSSFIHYSCKRNFHASPSVCASFGLKKNIGNERKPRKLRKPQKPRAKNHENREKSPEPILNPHILYFSTLSLFPPPNTLNSTPIPAPKPPHLQFNLAVFAVFAVSRFLRSKDCGGPSIE